MPINYVGNTGDAIGNHLVIQYRAAIDDHVAQQVVKGFTHKGFPSTSRTDINLIAIQVNFDPNNFLFEISIKDENAAVINVHVFINYCDNH